MSGRSAAANGGGWRRQRAGRGRVGELLRAAHMARRLPRPARPGDQRRAAQAAAPRDGSGAGRASECGGVLRLRGNVFGQVPRDLRRHTRRESGRHRAGRRGRGGVRRRELPDADRRPAVAPGFDGPRHAPGGSAGVQMTFERDARTALADGQLRGALRQATTLFGERRRAALSTVPAWEGARDRARAIKDETLEHLDRYLKQFAANAERAGARVHWARDAAEACDLIGAIAQRRGARTVVKSKSMATEEIHLNAALARRHIEPVETDLGEYIGLLAGETTSHLVETASQ